MKVGIRWTDFIKWLKHQIKVEPFQMDTRLLEEYGEVAKEINHWEDSGIKRKKYGEPSKEKLANELR